MVCCLQQNFPLVVCLFRSMSSLLARAAPSAAAARVRAQGARASVEATRAWRGKGGLPAPAAPAAGTAAVAASRGLCSAAPVAADEEDGKV